MAGEEQRPQVFEGQYHLLALGYQTQLEGLHIFSGLWRIPGLCKLGLDLLSIHSVL